MNLKIIIKQNRKKNFCILVVNKHKILNILGLLKNTKLYLDLNLLKYYLLLGSKISCSAKNIIYKKLKNKQINKNLISI